MKKIIIIFIAAIFMYIPNSNAVQEIESELTNSDIIENQMEDLNLGDFIKKSKEYAGEFMEDVDVGELFESAISGKIDNQPFFKKILNVLGKEIKNSIRVLGSIIIIIIIITAHLSIEETLFLLTHHFPQA